MQYRGGRRIRRIRREDNWVTLSPNSASAISVPLSEACNPNVKQTCSVVKTLRQWFDSAEGCPDRLLKALLEPRCFMDFTIWQTTWFILRFAQNLWRVLWASGTDPAMSRRCLELDCWAVCQRVCVVWKPRGSTNYLSADYIIFPFISSWLDYCTTKKPGSCAAFNRH